MFWQKFRKLVRRISLKISWTKKIVHLQIPKLEKIILEEYFANGAADLFKLHFFLSPP